MLYNIAYSHTPFLWTHLRCIPPDLELPNAPLFYMPLNRLVYNEYVRSSLDEATPAGTALTRQYWEVAHQHLARGRDPEQASVHPLLRSSVRDTRRQEPLLQGTLCPMSAPSSTARYAKRGQMKK